MATFATGRVGREAVGPYAGVWSGQHWVGQQSIGGSRLNLSGLTDKTYSNQHTQPEVTWQFKDLYKLFYMPERFVCMLFGGGRDVPSFNRTLPCAWFKRWLVGD